VLGAPDAEERVDKYPKCWEDYMQLQRILVAIDFKQPSLAAARWAAAQFKAATTLEMMHVSPVAEIPRFLGMANPIEGGDGPSLAGRIQGLRGFVDTLPARNATAQVRVGHEVSELRRRARLGGDH
jgi:hypothetical protein